MIKTYLLKTSTFKIIQTKKKLQTMWRLNHRRMLLNKVIFILLNQLMIIGIYGKLCEVETGQNNIILDIEETRGKNGTF